MIITVGKNHKSHERVTSQCECVCPVYQMLTGDNLSVKVIITIEDSLTFLNVEN